MKKLLLVCLLAGTRTLIAQNLDIHDFHAILEAKNADSINPYLAGKGFANHGPELLVRSSFIVRADAWHFKSDIHPEARMISRIDRFTDSTGVTLQFETSNPYFFSSLLNQLPGAGFMYQETIPGAQAMQILFSNGKEELLVITHQNNTGNFQFEYKKVKV